MNKRESETSKRHEQTRKNLARFQELHSKGCERFSGDWLRANTEATAAARYLGVDPSTPDIKTLLTETCFRILASFEKLEQLRPPDPGRPVIVCLCGSTRFMEAFQSANLQETLTGKIVLSVGCNTKSDLEVFGHLNPGEAGEVKTRLDELHKRKIDLADEILVLNVGGYVGESTRSEIDYAQAQGKRIRFLEPVEPAYFFKGEFKPDPSNVKIEVNTKGD